MAPNWRLVGYFRVPPPPVWQKIDTSDSKLMAVNFAKLPELLGKAPKS